MGIKLSDVTLKRSGKVEVDRGRMFLNKTYDSPLDILGELIGINTSKEIFDFFEEVNDVYNFPVDRVIIQWAYSQDTGWSMRRVMDSMQEPQWNKYGAYVTHEGIPGSKPNRHFREQIEKLVAEAQDEYVANQQQETNNLQQLMHPENNFNIVSWTTKSITLRDEEGRMITFTAEADAYGSGEGHLYPELVSE
jgi:hypothetical protein